MNLLRKNLLVLSDTQLAMLVAVAFEGINDLASRKEIADILSLQPKELETFGEDVVEPLLDSAHEILGWNTPAPCHGD